MGRISPPSAIAKSRTAPFLAQYTAGTASIRHILAKAYELGVKDSAQALADQQSGELREAWDRVMVGGNHLANVLIAKLGPYFPSKWPPEMHPEEAIRTLCATVEYDVWCCWRAIMLSRQALASTPSSSPSEMGREAIIAAIKARREELQTWPLTEGQIADAILAMLSATPAAVKGGEVQQEQEVMGGADAQPALVASLPEPETVSAHSGDGQAQGWSPEREAYYLALISAIDGTGISPGFARVSHQCADGFEITLTIPQSIVDEHAASPSEEVQ
jgi:hypothetical protein